jgi:hypothetical protein
MRRQNKAKHRREALLLQEAEHLPSIRCASCFSTVNDSNASSGTRDGTGHGG